MGYQPLLVTLVLMTTLETSNGLQKGRPTNYDVLNSQIDTLAVAVTGVLSDGHDRMICVKTGTRPVDNFVRQRIIEYLLRDKFRVMGDSRCSEVVRIIVPLVEVTYSAPVVSRIFGSADVIRTIRSEYDVEISDSSQTTFAKSYSMAFSDTVSESKIPDLETGSYSFLHGKIEGTSFLDTVLQPVLFVASAAVIVYLFFTLRGS